MLADVRRELRAARRDRWLARTAAAVLLLGVGWNGVNAMLGRRDAAALERGGPDFAAADVRGDSLVQTAAAVAEATDVATGRNVARQLAALSGCTLSDEQTAAIDAALRDHEG